MLTEDSDRMRRTSNKSNTQPAAPVVSSNRASPLGRHVSLVAMSTLFWIVFAVVTVVTGHSRFMENDDPAMASFVGGGYTGEPTGHAVFVGFLVGSIMAYWSRWMPNIPSYTLTLFTFDVLALAAMTCVVWTRRRVLGLPVVFALATILFFWATVLFLRPTFTMTAMCLGLAGVLVVMYTHAGYPSRFAAILGAGGIAVAAGVRWDSMVAMLVVPLPIIACKLRLFPWRKNVEVIGFTLFFLSIVVGANVIGDREPEWSAYRQFNEVRGALNSTRQLEMVLWPEHRANVAPTLAANDWTIHDVELFDGWLFEDPAVYSTEKIKRLLDLARHERFRTNWSTAWGLVVNGRGVLLATIVSCALMTLWRGRRSALLVAAQMGWAAISSLYVARTMRFPTRIAIPIALALCLVMLLAASDSQAPRALVQPSKFSSLRRWRRYAVWASLGLFVVVGTIPLWRLYGPSVVSRDNASLIKQHEDQLRRLRAVDSKGTFVLVGSSLPFVGVNALTAPGYYVRMDILPMGWPNQSPPQQERLRKMGLSRDILGSVLNDPHRYLVINKRLVEPIAAVMGKRHGKTVKLVKVVDLLPNSAAYRVVSIKTNGS